MGKQDRGWIRTEKKRRGRKSDDHQGRCAGPLAESEAEAESQLILLDLSVSVDVAVTHQGLPELVQVTATDAGLQEVGGAKDGRG